MAVTQNYVGKNVDFCVFETPSYPGPGPVNVGISDSGSVVSGPYKVVQKFTKFLLTEKGSVPSDPEYGTSFITKLLGGQISTNLALAFEYYSDVGSVLNFVNSSVLTPSADENLLDVQLESLNVTLDTAVMRLKFYFSDSSVILAPVTISTV